VTKGKGNPCHKPAGTSEGGEFCETGGSTSVGRWTPTGDKESDVDNKAWLQRIKEIEKKQGLQPKWAQGLKDKMLTVGGHAAFIDTKDPDAKQLVSGGQFYLPGTTGVTRMIGKDNQCHWNAADLYKAGKIDAVVTGYALDDIRLMWRQHSWGLKGGKIVETTEGNLGSSAYFGVKYTGKDAAEFRYRIGPRPKTF
jgi:hypothetical protein